MKTEHRLPRLVIVCLLGFAGTSTCARSQMAAASGDSSLSGITVVANTNFPPAVVAFLNKLDSMPGSHKRTISDKPLVDIHGNHVRRSGPTGACTNLADALDLYLEHTAVTMEAMPKAAFRWNDWLVFSLYGLTNGVPNCSAGFAIKCGTRTIVGWVKPPSKCGQLSSKPSDLAMAKKRAKRYLEQVVASRSRRRRDVPDAVAILKRGKSPLSDDVAMVALGRIASSLGTKSMDWSPAVASNYYACVEHLGFIRLDSKTRKTWPEYRKLSGMVLDLSGGDTLLALVARMNVLGELAEVAERAERDGKNVVPMRTFIRSEAKVLLDAWPEPHMKQLLIEMGQTGLDRKNKK